MADESKQTTRPYTVLVATDMDSLVAGGTMKEALAEDKRLWIEVGTVEASSRRQAIKQVLGEHSATCAAIANFAPIRKTSDTKVIDRWEDAA